MADPVAVLVIPAPGDPGGLLAETSLGARAPIAMALRLNADRHVDMRAPLRWLAWHEVPESLVAGTNEEILHALNAERALPLWWDGALVPEGWDRARRVITAQGWTAFDALPTRAWCMEPRHPLDVLLLAEDLVTRGRASRVVMLDLVDGRLVEREVGRG